MIVDITGTPLTPGNFGKDCLGNGEREGIEICCDECDYYLCCIEENYQHSCTICDDKECPQYKLF